MEDRFLLWDDRGAASEMLGWHRRPDLLWDPHRPSQESRTLKGALQSALYRVLASPPRDGGCKTQAVCPQPIAAPDHVLTCRPPRTRAHPSLEELSR